MRLILLFASAVLLVGMAIAAHAEPPTPPPYAPTLLIYAAKGPPNACGEGCDRWIAVEGQFDGEAAARFRRFLRSVKDDRSPFYFHSPGGDVRQAFAIGRMLRARKARVRVSRTVLAACGTGSQIDDACLKIKSGASEVLAEIASAGSMCNSACVYSLLGGTTREIPPEATVAVHNSKLTLYFRGGRPTAQQRAAFMAGQRQTANRELGAFIASMGIDRGLFDLIETVKFEDMHALTRAEIYRFKIDNRDLVETNWTSASPKLPAVYKVAFVKENDTPSFKKMEWYLACRGKTVSLLLLRGAETNPAVTTKLAFVLGSQQFWASRQNRPQVGTELWSAAIPAALVKDFFAPPLIQIGQRTVADDGKTTESSVALETRSFADAWAQLSPSCAGAVLSKPIEDNR